jgi:hypothetical protein
LAIDLRANATCSLGPLISASISDDYIQENGLIKVKGNCVIAGIVTPSAGSVVTFSYTKGGNSYQIPRTLRVLSSFADPFRNITTVELGCKLTYLEDVKAPIDWNSLEQEGNEAYVEEDKDIIVIPVLASSAAFRCVSELGITVSTTGVGLLLANRFSIETFDFSAGFVSVLSDLLVSENLCGYLDINEELVVIDLSKEGDLVTKVIPEEDIIDVGPIGVGGLPGDAVIVSFSYNKYKFPEVTEELTPEEEAQIPAGVPSEPLISVPAVQPREVLDFTYSENTTPEEFYYVTADNLDGEEVTVEYSGAGYSTSYSNYVPRSFVDRETGERQERDVVIEKFDKNYGPSIADTSAIATDYLAKGIGFNNTTILRSSTDTYYTYNEFGEVDLEIVEQYQSVAGLVAGLGAPFAFEQYVNTNTVAYTYVTVSYEPVCTGVKITKYNYYDNIQQTITNEWKDYALTQRGQQGVSKSVEKGNIETPSSSGRIIDYYCSRAIAVDSNGYTTILPSNGGPLTHIGQSVSVDVKGVIVPPKPSTSTIIGQNGETLAAKEEDPIPQEDVATTDSPEVTIGSTSEIILASGSQLAERRVEFSMPYAEDEWFQKKYANYDNTTYAKYSVVPSRAPQIAKTYGIIQNRLLLGNRSGMSIQVPPELLPNAPFDPIAVEIKGITAMYRLNGTSWQIDNTGIVASTDALFWGGIGAEPSSTGEIWFPVAPGVTQLPETPPVVNGSITVDSVVPPWNEINIINLNTKSILIAGRLGYSIEPKLKTTDISTRTVLQGDRVRYVFIPSAIDFALSIGTGVRPQASQAIRPAHDNTLDYVTDALAPRAVYSVDARITTVPDTIIGFNSAIVGSEVGTFIKPGFINIDIAFNSAVTVGREIGKFIKPGSVVISIAAGSNTRPTSTVVRPIAMNIAVIRPVPQVGRQVGKFVAPSAMVIAVQPLAPSVL